MQFSAFNELALATKIKRKKANAGVVKVGMDGNEAWCILSS